MEIHAMKKFYFSFCMLCANLLALVAGMMLSWASPVIPKLSKLTSENPIGVAISDSETSWITALVPLGATFGPFIAAFISDQIGRKWALVLIGVPFVTSFFTLAFAEAVWIYMLARFIAGLSIGGTFTVLPMYIAEMSPVHLRGAMGSIMNTFIASGLMLSYVIGPFISILWYNIICAIVAVVFVVLFFLLMPETPQYLVSKGRETEAKNVLIKLRCTELENLSISTMEENIKKPNTAIDDEFLAICDVVRENSGGSIKDLTTRGNTKGMILTCSLLVLQQFSGINCILMYAQLIFDATGSTISSDISPIVIGGVQVFTSFVTPALADKAGRRILCIVSAAGMLIAQVPLGAYFYLQNNRHNVDYIFWLPLACLVLYIAMYNTGMGPLPWTITAEMFPPNVKGIASSLAASSCWFLAFILTKFFTDVSVQIGMAGSFWLFSGFNLVTVVFALTYMLETKGKSQKEIQQMLSK